MSYHDEQRLIDRQERFRIDSSERSFLRPASSWNPDAENKIPLPQQSEKVAPETGEAE